MQGLEILEAINKYGVLPLFIIAISYLISQNRGLSKKVTSLENSVNELNIEHKKDLRLHGDEVKSIVQNTITTLNDFKSSVLNRIT